MALEMLTNGRAIRRIPPSDLRCRIFHRAFRRLQPSRPISIPVAIARLRAVLVIVAPDRVARFALKRLLDNQPGRQLDQFVLCRCCGKASFDQCRQLFTRALRSTYSRCHGVLLCRHPKPIAHSHPQRMHPAHFPATFQTSPGADWVVSIGRSFEQSAAVVRIGWKSQVFFLAQPLLAGLSAKLRQRAARRFDHCLHLALSCASMVASVAREAACCGSFGNPAL